MTPDELDAFEVGTHVEVRWEERVYWGSHHHLIPRVTRGVVIRKPIIVRDDTEDTDHGFFAIAHWLDSVTVIP